MRSWVRRRDALAGCAPLTDPHPGVALGTSVSPIVVVAVNSSKLVRDRSTALRTDARLIGVDPEIHHPRTTPTLVDPIARPDGVAIGDVFNPIRE